MPLEGATQAPIEFIQRADASVEGEAPKALPLEGATQAPIEFIQRADASVEG
ncbi:MAG: hypothetical protein HZA13_03275, partial [Nitrospirae bacterium]|nr:hypothetical protein [Nitrospirota bacterium]